MHHKRPFFTRIGDGGFNPPQIPASKGDGGFRPPAQLAYRAWLRWPWAVAGPGRASTRGARLHISDPAPLVWRAPEGPEGTGGLRGAAPNAVRSPSLAGGRGLRRPEHPWGHKQHQQAGGPPPTGTPSSPAPQNSTCGARNTRGATSAARTKPQHTARGPKRLSASGPSHARASVAHRLS